MAPDPKTVGEAFGWLWDGQWTMTMSDTGEAGAGTLCECGRTVEVVKRADGQGWRWAISRAFLFQCCVRTANELIASMTKGDRPMDLTDAQVENIRTRLVGQTSAPAVETLAAIEELQRRRKEERIAKDISRWVPTLGALNLEEALAFAVEVLETVGPSADVILPAYPLKCFLNELKGWRSGPASRPDPTPTVRVPSNLPGGEARVSVSLAEEILRNQDRKLQDLRAAKQKTDDEVASRWFVVEDANVAVLVDLSCVLTVAFAGVNVWVTVDGDTEGPHKFFYETVPGAKFVFDQIRSAVRAWEDRPNQFLSGLWPGQVPPTARP